MVVLEKGSVTVNARNFGTVKKIKKPSPSQVPRRQRPALFRLQDLSFSPPGTKSSFKSVS